MLTRPGGVGARPRVLLVVEDATAERAKALSALFSSSEGPVEVVTKAATETVEPASFDGVVLDGLPQVSSEWIARLDEAVRRGACLLALAPRAGDEAWSDFLSLLGSEERPAGEWFVKVSQHSSALTERMRAEFALSDRPLLLSLGEEYVPLLTTNVAYADRVVAAERREGEGRIVVTGLGRAHSALSSAEVALLFRRCLRPPHSYPPAGRSLGLAVVGYGPYGGMGLYHGLAAAATDGLEMIAACDSDPSRRKAAEQEFPGLRPYASLSELLSDDDVAVVVVATPPSSHHELARDLLRGGKHVVLEKPMCLGLSEANELISLADENHLVLTVHQSRRFDPDYLLLRRAVEEGLIGSLFNIETFVGGFEHPCRAWHSHAEISGGAVYDWGSHHLDWILQLMGAFPRSLVAHGHKRVWHDVTNFDQVRVRLSWSDGREAEFLQSDVAGIRKPKFYLQGTAGTIAGYYRPLRFETIEPGLGYVCEAAHHAEAPVSLVLARYEAGLGLSETTLAPVAAERYEFHRNLADHLLFGEPLAVTPQSARDVVALLETAQRSSDEGGRPIDLEALDRGR